MSNSNKFPVTSLGLLAFIAGCTTMPAGPSIMALPGTGKSFEQFRRDDGECRSFAQGQIGQTTAEQAGINSGVESAAVGTALGAVAGAAVGGHNGAGAGAATGLLVGSAAGVGAGQASAYGAQRRYDFAYIQCMYAKGEQVPVAGPMHAQPEWSHYPPAPSYGMPLPPPGPARLPPPG